MALSDSTVRNAKPGVTLKGKVVNKSYKLHDTDGLFLLVDLKGGKWWRFKYRFDGRERGLSLGVYPAVSLSKAREKRDAARKQVADGIDPSAARKAEKAAKTAKLAAVANRFETLAREWFAKQETRWAENHSSKIIRRLERDVFPALGHKDITAITAVDVKDVITRVDDRGATETAHRILNDIKRVFDYAGSHGFVQTGWNPAVGRAGVLRRKVKGHLAAVTDPADVGGMLRILDGYKGTYQVCCALKLAPLVFVRPGELRLAKWKDINLDKAEWAYKVSKTRNSGVTDLIVPLARQAVELLRELHKFTGGSEYVFPSPRGWTRAISDNAVLAAMRRSGIGTEEMCGHGFRAMARTILAEVLGYDAAIIELQLAHVVLSPLGRAYDRTAFLPQRRVMMQAWADYLDELKAGKE